MMNDYGEHLYTIHNLHSFFSPLFLVSSFLPSTIPLTRSACCLSLALYGYGRQNFDTFYLASILKKHINL